MMNEKSDRFMEDIALIVASQAIKQGVDEKTANAIAMSSADEVSLQYGGSNLYLTKDRAILKRQRDLYAAYSQMQVVDYSDLSRRFQLSERYIRFVLNRMIAEARANRQRGLFPLPDDSSQWA